jgi:hypothetical protein
MKKQDQKFDEIVTSYINGNISWVKEQVKKMRKDTRKNLYEWAKNNFGATDIHSFFFNLI